MWHTVFGKFINFFCFGFQIHVAVILVQAIKSGIEPTPSSSGVLPQLPIDIFYISYNIFDKFISKCLNSKVIFLIDYDLILLY